MDLAEAVAWCVKQKCNVDFCGVGGVRLRFWSEVDGKIKDVSAFTFLEAVQKAKDLTDLESALPLNAR